MFIISFDIHAARHEVIASEQKTVFEVIFALKERGAKNITVFIEGASLDPDLGLRVKSLSPGYMMFGAEGGR